MAVPSDPDLAPPSTPLPASVAAVFLGGVAGGLAREGIGVAIPGGTIPWAILLINVLGSLLLGVIVEVVATRLLHRHPKLAVRLFRPAFGTGFCGGFTTFSSFAVALDIDLRDGRPGPFLLYLGLSLVLGLVAVAAGLALGRRLTS